MNQFDIPIRNRTMRSVATAIWDLFDHSSDCFIETDKHGVIRRANKAAIALFGIALDRLVGMSVKMPIDTWLPIVPTLPHFQGQPGESQTRPHVTITLPDGRVFEATRVVTDGDGEDDPFHCLLVHPSSSSYNIDLRPSYREGASGSIPMQQRLALLAEASRAFTEASLDLDAVMEIVTRSISSYVGDTCVIRLLSEDGAWLHPVAVYHCSSDARELARKVNASFSQRADSGPASIVVRSGKALLVPHVDQQELRASANPDYVIYLDTVGVTSLIMVPLRVRGVVIGTLGVARDHGGAPYTYDDQTLVQELADRAALAVENARLYGAMQKELAERRRAEELYRLVTHATTDAVWDWDLVNNTIWRSPVLRTLFGYMPSEMASHVDWWYERIHPDDRRHVVESVREAIDGESGGWTAEYRFRRSDGAYAYIRDTARLVRDEDGRPVRMIGAMSDVTQARETEEALRHAHDILVKRVEERTAEVMDLMRRMEDTRTLQQRFVADASHDLRTPLTIVRAELDLLRLRPEHDPRTRESLDRIHAESKRLDQLANDLLLLATLDSLAPDDTMRIVQLEELVVDAVSDLSAVTREKDIIWDIQIDGATEITCVEQMVRRALMNLLENAVEHSAAGRMIHIVVGKLEGRAFIEVHDEGEGISPENLTHVFDRFYRTDVARNSSGTGLGLAIVKSVMDVHGGQVAIESEVGKGTIVRLIFSP